MPCGTLKLCTFEEIQLKVKVVVSPSLRGYMAIELLSVVELLCERRMPLLTAIGLMLPFPLLGVAGVKVISCCSTVMSFASQLRIELMMVFDKKDFTLLVPSFRRFCISSKRFSFW